MDMYAVRDALNDDVTLIDQGGWATALGNEVKVHDREGEVVARLQLTPTGDVYMYDGEGFFGSAPWDFRDSMMEEAIGAVIESGLSR